MAYETTNPPLLTNTQPIVGPKEWIYVSSHSRATVVSSTFGFSNAGELGIKVGDLFTICETTTSGANAATDIRYVSKHVVTLAGSTYTAMSAGWLVSSAS